jgi:hypothetical protein
MQDTTTEIMFASVVQCCAVQLPSKYQVGFTLYYSCSVQLFTHSLGSGVFE